MEKIKTFKTFKEFINEEGEGTDSNLSPSYDTLQSVSGMGDIIMPTANNDGSGDIIIPYKKRKFKKRKFKKINTDMKNA